MLKALLVCSWSSFISLKKFSLAAAPVVRLYTQVILNPCQFYRLSESSRFSLKVKYLSLKSFSTYSPYQIPSFLTQEGYIYVKLLLRST